MAAPRKTNQKKNASGKGPLLVEERSQKTDAEPVKSPKGPRERNDPKPKNPNRGLSQRKFKTDKPVPPKPKAKPAEARKAKTDASAPPKPKAKPAKSTPEAAKKPTFKGNWVGAAPTAMQARGGQKIQRKSLLSLFRK